MAASTYSESLSATFRLSPGQLQAFGETYQAEMEKIAVTNPAALALLHSARDVAGKLKSEVGEIGSSLNWKKHVPWTAEGKVFSAAKSRAKEQAKVMTGVETAYKKDALRKMQSADGTVRAGGLDDMNAFHPPKPRASAPARATPMPDRSAHAAPAADAPSTPTPEVMEETKRHLLPAQLKAAGAGAVAGAGVIGGGYALYKRRQAQSQSQDPYNQYQ